MKAAILNFKTQLAMKATPYPPFAPDDEEDAAARGKRAAKNRAMKDNKRAKKELGQAEFEQVLRADELFAAEIGRNLKQFAGVDGPMLE